MFCMNIFKHVNARHLHLSQGGKIIMQKQIVGQIVMFFFFYINKNIDKIDLYNRLLAALTSNKLVLVHKIATQTLSIIFLKILLFVFETLSHDWLKPLVSNTGVAITVFKEDFVKWLNNQISRQSSLQSNCCIVCRLSIRTIFY